MNKKQANFTSGNIVMQMIAFAVPIVLGELLQNLYHSVDTAVVGNFVGSTALASVSVCESPSNLVVGFFNGMSLGATALVSRAVGRGDKERIARAMSTTFSFSLIMGVAMSVLCVLLSPLLLKMTGANDEIYGPALLYLRIYMIGLMFTVIYNIGSGILRALGDSRGPFLILAIACGLNVVLDFLLVAGLRFGIAGAAIATIFAQGTAAFLVYRRLKAGNPDFYLDRHVLVCEQAYIADFLRIGMPTGLQNSLTSISNIFVWRYINSFPTDVVSGIGIGQRLDRFVGMPSKAFGSTITAFVGQNEGAGNHQRGRKGLRVCLWLSFATVGVLGIALYLAAEPCVRLFAGDDYVVSIGVAMMRTMIPLYYAMYLRNVLAGALRAYGETRIPTLLSLAGMIVVRQIYLAVAMSRSHNVETIYYAYPVGWIAAAVMVAVYAIWKLKKIDREREENG